MISQLNPHFVLMLYLTPHPLSFKPSCLNTKWVVRLNHCLDHISMLSESIKGWKTPMDWVLSFLFLNLHSFIIQPHIKEIPSGKGFPSADYAEEPLDWLANTKLTAHVALAEGKSGASMDFSPSIHGLPEVPICKIQGMGEQEALDGKKWHLCFYGCLTKCISSFKYEYGQPNLMSRKYLWPGH